jgi:hypothetical protein
MLSHSFKRCFRLRGRSIFPFFHTNSSTSFKIDQVLDEIKPDALLVLGASNACLSAIPQRSGGSSCRIKSEAPTPGISAVTQQKHGSTRALWQVEDNTIAQCIGKGCPD